MLSIPTNSELSAVNEAYSRMLRCDEGLTIPQNKDDKVEVELYKALGDGYTHGDRIVRWYRNAKKSGAGEGELKTAFVRNIANIKDLFNTYELYLESLKKMKLLGKKISVNVNGRDALLDPVKDVDKIRRLEGFRALVEKMGDMVHSDTAIDTTSEKYAITDEDRKKIKVLGFTEHVVCWSTEGYETTNKFVYQLWQNSKTLGRGDAYGDASEQTPYCTHSKEHWDDYSHGYARYKQFWFLRRPIGEGLTVEKGDLTNGSVVAMFNELLGEGPVRLIAMTDSGNDLLDHNDQHVENAEKLFRGNEISKLMDELFVKKGLPVVSIGGCDVIISGRGYRLVPKEDLKDDEDEKDDTIEVLHTDLSIDIDDFVKKSDCIHGISSLEGCPRVVDGDFFVSRQPHLKSLIGSPYKVTHSVKIQDCSGLKSLEGFPKDVGSEGGYVEINNCDSLVGLNGFPKSFGGYVEIRNCKSISTIDGLCDISVKELILAGLPSLESLKGCPSSIDDRFEIDGCQNLKSLDYAPVVNGTLNGIRISPNANITPSDIQNYVWWSYGYGVSKYEIDGEEKSWMSERTRRMRWWFFEHCMNFGMNGERRFKQEGASMDDAMEKPLNELKHSV